HSSKSPSTAPGCGPAGSRFALPAQPGTAQHPSPANDSPLLSKSPFKLPSQSAAAPELYNEQFSFSFLAVKIIPFSPSEPPALAFARFLTENSPLSPESSKSPAASSSVAQRKAPSEFDARISALLAGQNSDPFGILGPHPVSSGWAIRFFIPWAAEASI